MGWKKTQVLSVFKGQETKDEQTGEVLSRKPDYIKFNNHNKAYFLQALQVPSEKGISVQLESPSFQKARLQEALAAGKLNEEYVQKQIARLDKCPEYLRFEGYLIEKGE